MNDESLSTNNREDGGAQDGSAPPDLASRLFLQLGPRVLNQATPKTDDALAVTVIGQPGSEQSEGGGPSLSVAGLPPRYERLQELDRGGQGRVLLAWDAQAKREVAIKLLLYATPRNIGLLLDEGKTLAQIDNPGIVRLLDIGWLTAEVTASVVPRTAEVTPEVAPSLETTVAAIESHAGAPYLVLEFVRGQTLDLYVRKQRPSVREIVRIVARIAEAVGKAHSLQIVHRDLKPANILMTEACEPKVLDFGLSQDERLRRNATSDGIVAGTWNYMSPEQSRGEETSAATDVYALGVTLYQLLSNTLPIHPKGPASNTSATPDGKLIQDRIAHQLPTPLRERDKSLPRELEDICDCCLRKATNERYATAGALADDLRRFLNHEPIGAWRGWRIGRGRDICFGWRGPYVASKFVRRQTLPVSMAVMIVAGAVISYWRVSAERNEAVRLAGVARTNEGRANHETRRANDNAERAERNRELAETARRESESRRYRLLIDTAERASESRKFHDAQLAAGEAELIETTWETARLKFEAGADRFTSRRLAEHHWGLTAAVLSPDRKRLVSAGADGALLVWDMETGRALPPLSNGELRDHGRLRRHCAISVDGRPLTEPTPFVTGLCWLGASDQFVSASYDGTVRVHSLSQSEVRTLPARPAALYSVAADARGESILMGDARGGVSLWQRHDDEFQLACEATVADSPITAVVRSPGESCWFAGTERGELLALSNATLDVVDRVKMSNPVWCLDPLLHDDAIRSVGPDLIAVASGQASVKVFTIKTDEHRLLELASLRLPKLSQQAQVVRWDLGGVRLFALDDQGLLLEWDTKELVRSAAEINLPSKPADAENAATRPSHVSVPLLRATFAIRVRDNDPHRDPLRIEALPLPLPLRRRGTVLLPLNAKQVITGGEDVVLRVWDEPSAPDRTNLKVGMQPRLVFDPKRPTRLWAATDDGKLALHETGNPEPQLIAEVDAHRGAVTGVVALPKAKLIATAGRDGAVRLWQHEAQRGLVQVGEGISHTEPLLSLAVSHHERWLAAVDATNRLVVWDVGSRRVERQLNLDDDDHSEPLTGAVGFNADDTRLAAVGASQSSAVFNTAGFERLRDKITVAGRGGTDLQWHPTDPDLIFAIDSIRRFVSLDLSGRHRLPHLLMHGWEPPNSFVALRGTSDGKRLLLIDRAGLLVSFDPAHLGIVMTRDIGLKDVCALALDRASRRVAVADERGNVSILETGLVPEPLPDTSASVALWKSETWIEEARPFSVDPRDFRLDAHGRPALLTRHVTDDTRHEIALRYHARRLNSSGDRFAPMNLDEIIDDSGLISANGHVWQWQPNGEPMIVYRKNVADQVNSGEIMLAQRHPNGRWNTRAISPPGNHGAFPTLHVRPAGTIDVFHFAFKGHFWQHTKFTDTPAAPSGLGLQGDGMWQRMETDSLGRHHFAFRMAKFNAESGPPMYARLDGEDDDDLALREPIDVRSGGSTHFWIGRGDIPTAITLREGSHGSKLFVVMRRHADIWQEERLPAALAGSSLDILERPDGSLIAVTWDDTEQDIVFWEQRDKVWWPTPLRVTWPAAPNVLALRLDPRGEPVVAAFRVSESPSWVRVIRRVTKPR